MSSIASRVLVGVWVLGVLSAQAPPNDNCINASLVAVGGSSGYEYGTYYSDTVQITNATLQAGEYIPPLVPNGKTVWYKFFLPTTRSVRIVLREDGISIDPTKAGWTLYYTNACLPNATHKVDPPIVQMEGYTHECLRRGWYLVQVGSDLAVTGKVFLEIITQPSSAPEAIYDLLAHAQNLGMLSTSHNILIKDVSWEAGCQGLHQGERICDNTLPRDSTWSKSSWHVFRTDGWIDWLGIRLEETPWDNTNSNPRTWRINLYKGDARTDSAGLILVDSCINLMQYTSGVPAERDYMCLLEPNTWYSIQILYPTTYFGNMRLRLYERGIGPTASPNPNTIPSTHNLGTLGFGTYNFSDVLACNARIALNRCGTIAGADTIDGYDLNLWYKFTLSAAVDVRFQYSIPWWWGGPTLRFRLFSGDPAVDGCNLPLVGQWDGGNYLYRCLPAGTYVVQVLGRINRPYAWNSGSNLGVPINFSVQVLSTPQQLFGLHSPTEVNVINGGSPLVSGTTYWVTRDTFDCRTTVLPAGDVCGAANNRASYRIVEIGQNGILSVGDEENCWDLRLRIYRGDARTEPIVGGRIQNLVDQVGCQGPCWWEPVKVCVTPGTYTLVTFGDEGDVGRTTRYWVRFDAFPPTLFTDPLATDPNPPENMGTLSLSNPSISATPTRFSCIDNPNTILGYAPCYGATKLIYREVYIAQPSLVTFIDQTSRHPNIWGDGSVVYRTFRGRISNNTLTSLYKDCHGGFTACMEPGWYTIVAYGYTGGTYTNPTYTSGRGGVIGNLNQFTISMDTRVQKFGTFATADRSYSGDPGRDSIRWYNTGTVTVPLNHKSYGFDWEFWPCANNLPFPPGITSCNPSDNRISYRVFQLTRPSYLIINGSGYYSSMRLYQGDITQSAPPYTIIHDCAGSPMRICWLPPGMYTLVTFASDAHIGQTFTPSIYVDSVGYSLHDWANAAYDFGEIPPDNTEYRTAPLGSPDPLGRPGSTDFIFCTTTAHPSNPSSNCPLGGNWPAVPYPFPDNLAGDYRRNLWYTFTVTGPGRIYVTVQNKTSGGAQPAFSVYESDDVNFPTVVDSTIPSGLSVVATSQIPLRCCDQYTTVSFYREPCTPQPKKRYYIVVNRNTCGKEPNLQIEVGIRFEPVPSYFVKYDHYSTANEISGNPTLICDAPYPGGTLAAGTYTGCQGDLTCATKDPTDQNTCGIRTLWYKFTSDITGYVYLNYDRVGVENYRYNPDDIQLYVQLVPGDSTSSGLARVPLTDGWYVHPDLGNRRWGRGCVHKGQTYYIMLTGCNHLGYVVPRIWLEPHTGDFCTDSVLISVTGTGTYSVQRIIDCFTIGEAPGENDTLVGCMGSPIGQKTMWVLVHNQTLDTMDFDIEIIENTTALGPQIKYRVLSGDCSAMNQEECVKEGAYIILHLKCRPPMQSFWVQVMLPNWARGDIEVKVTANPISRTCRPVNPDCPIARFDQIVGCPDQPVQFLNYSSIGPGISYWWDFGDGFTSNLFAPQHLYALPDTYMVTLIVSNGSCNDTSQRFLIVYPKPTVSVTYTPASPVWVGVPISFTPTYTDTALGSNTIYWDFCAGNVGAPPWCPTCGASLVDYTGSTPPAVSYACPGKKKICVQLNNAGICDTMFCFEVDVVFPPIYAGGPYDGAAEGASYASCATLSYVGGPYDGAAEGSLYASCNFYVGGPYDGAAEGASYASCATLSYVGGPYDGAAEGSLYASCNFYVGGPYDGAVEGASYVNCATLSYVGGPYDGAAEEAFWAVCHTPTWYTGGPYDGAAEGALIVCPPPTHVYAGGPYDGTAEGSSFSSCLTLAYVGGPYDGAAEGSVFASCNLYAGGPYDGAAEGSSFSSCLTLAYVGGPYDGAAEGSVFASCNLYAGGPYDGAAEGSSFSSCLTLAYAGGPYDGAAEGTTFANCNFYVGGPYDGAAEGYYASFWVRDTSVCYGQPAQLVASSPSDWYSTPTGGTPVATGTNLLNLGPITSSQIYYVGNACISSRVPVVAIAQPKLQAAFVYSPTSPDSACVGQPVYFSNQTLVSGPSQPSLGSLIVGLSSPGSPPPMGHLSFSSQQTANFSLLANGVHNGGNAWTANNTGASTQWAQWYYVTPRSVNRIVFWNCATCPNAANRVPVRARLYYDQGSGWKLAKVFSGSLAGNFDSGIFYETQAIFAQRWKLELDVTAPNAPAWGEFQVYSSAPIIGGTVQWNFGDGSPWASGGNVSHAYTVPGSYTVTQVVNAPGACPDTLTKTVEIRPCGPLPAVQVQLAGNITPKATIALRWQTNFPIRWARLEKLIEGQWRSIYEHTETTQQFGYEDTLPLFFEPNVYRVFSVHENGAQLYSNVVSFVLDKVMEPFVRVFPNPVQDILNIQFGLPQDGEVGIVVYDAKGAKVREISPQRVSKGLHQWNLETYLWSTGIYFIQVELDGKTYSPRVLKIYP